MRCLTLVATVAGLMIGCAQPLFAASGSMGPTSERPVSGAPAGESTVGPEERLKQNQVEVDRGLGDGAFRADQAKGVSGDPNAALRVAEIYRRGSNGVSPNERRMLQWLLHASALNNAAASYQLYHYFLLLRLDREAVYFENRAVDQGFTLPPRLDPKRN